MESAGIYDLGEVERSPSDRRPTGVGSAAEWNVRDSGGGAARGRGISVSATRPMHSPADRLTWVPPSLSLLLPGTGQFVVGNHAAGLFYLSSMGFLAAFAWAIHDSIGRLTASLPWIGLPPQVAFWFLPVAWLTAAALHVMCVLHAYSLATDEPVPPHPFAAAFISLLIPGWGQVLNGALWRAAFLLSGLWIMAGVAWLILPWGASLLANVGLSPLLKGAPPWIGPTLLAVPVVVWILAAYDAASCAAARRR